MFARFDCVAAGFDTSLHDYAVCTQSKRVFLAMTDGVHMVDLSEFDKSDLTTFNTCYGWNNYTFLNDDTRVIDKSGERVHVMGDKLFIWKASGILAYSI
jgi:hypothetical protein